MSQAKSHSQTDEDKSEESNVDARIERAMSEFFSVEQGEYGDETYRIHSGSGSIYAVDLDGPDGYHCSCDDPAPFCKHLLYILVVERPGYLLECKHGNVRCPGVEAISFSDGEPECDGQLPCFDCFMEAHRAILTGDERDRSATEASA